MSSSDWNSSQDSKLSYYKWASVILIVVLVMALIYILSITVNKGEPKIVAVAGMSTANPFAQAMAPVNGPPPLETEAPSYDDTLWFVEPDRVNSYTIYDLIGRVNTGNIELTRNTRVWHEGMEDWMPASEVSELAMLFDSPLPMDNGEVSRNPPSCSTVQVATVRTYSGNNAVISQGPNTESAYIGNVPSGATVLLVSQEETGWYRVVYGDSIGYIDSTLLTGLHETTQCWTGPVTATLVPLQLGASNGSYPQIELPVPSRQTVFPDVPHGNRPALVAYEEPFEDGDYFEDGHGDVDLPQFYFRVITADVIKIPGLGIDCVSTETSGCASIIINHYGSTAMFRDAEVDNGFTVAGRVFDMSTPAQVTLAAQALLDHYMYRMTATQDGANCGTIDACASVQWNVVIVGNGEAQAHWSGTFYR